MRKIAPLTLGIQNKRQGPAPGILNLPPYAASISIPGRSIYRRSSRQPSKSGTPPNPSASARLPYPCLPDNSQMRGKNLLCQIDSPFQGILVSTFPRRRWNSLLRRQTAERQDSTPLPYSHRQWVGIIKVLWRSVAEDPRSLKGAIVTAKELVKPSRRRVATAARDDPYSPRSRRSDSGALASFFRITERGA